MIAGCAMSLDHNRGGTVELFTAGSAPNRRYIISYRNVDAAGSNTTSTFQTVLYERTNAIKIRHSRCVTSGQSGVVSVGTENDRGDVGLNLLTGSRVDSRNTEWTITPPDIQVYAANRTFNEGDTLTTSGTCLPNCNATNRVWGWDTDRNGTIDQRGLTISDPNRTRDGPFDHSLRFGWCRGTDCAFDPLDVRVNNVAPRITSSAPTSVQAGTLYEYRAAATDPAPAGTDPFQWSLPTKPSGMTINASTGYIRWTALPGSHNVVLRVEDGDGGSHQQQWTIQSGEEGGPDAAGYRWQRVASASWSGIDRTGTRITPAQGRMSPSIRMGMVFNYYGRQYANVRISPDGYVSFENSASSVASPTSSMPSAQNPNAMIAALWGPMNLVGGAIHYRTTGRGASTRFIVQYTNVRPLAGGAPNTFQVVLHAGKGDAEIICLRCSMPQRAVMGFENDRGDIGLSIRNAAFTVNNATFRMIAPSMHVSVGGPYAGTEGSPMNLAASCYGCQRFEWDIDGDGRFEFAGRTATFTPPDGPATFRPTVRAWTGSTSRIDSRTVSVANAPPRITSSGASVRITVGQSFDVQARATDPGQDTLRWSVSATGIAATINAATGLVTLRGTAVGNGTVTVTVTDGESAPVSQVWSVQTVPALDMNGPYTVVEGGTVDITPTCVGCTRIQFDLDGNGSYETTANTGRYVGLDGTVFGMLRARGCGGPSNSLCSEMQTTVTTVNVAPTFTTSPGTTATAGVTYRYDAAATDPAGARDTISFHRVSGPAGLVVTTATGQVVWSSPVAGNHVVAIDVRDEDGGSRRQTWTIAVSPRITSAGPFSVNEGASVLLSAQCDGCTRTEWDLDRNGSYETTNATPTFSASGRDGPGTQTVGVRVCASLDNSLCTVSTANIVINNVAPTFTSTPPRGAAVGQVYTYQAAATDPAGARDPITFSNGGAPTGVTVSSSGLVRWANPAVGSHWVRVRASDGDGGTTTQSYQLIVVSADARGPYTVNEGAGIQLSGDCEGCSIFEWDLDNNGVYETVGRSPQYAAADGSVNVQVQLRVCSTGRVSCATATADINIVNVAPSIDTTPPRAVLGQAYSYDVNATDPAAAYDPLRWSLTQNPTGMSINLNTGVITWANPTAGAHAVAVRVIDGDGGEDAQTFTLSVLDIDAGGPYTVLEGSSVDFAASCTACDRYEWDLDGNGSFETTQQNPTFRGNDGPATPQVTLRVCAGPGTTNCVTERPSVTVNNGAPTFVATPRTSATIGQQYIYVAAASDPSGDYDELLWNLVASPSGMTIASSNGQIRWTPSSAGSFNVTVRVADDDGGSSTQSFTIVVPNGLTANGPYSVDEGASVALTAGCLSCSTYDWDLDNNGSYETAGRSVSFNGTDGPATETVRVRGCDSGNNCATAATTVVVSNVAPDITSSAITAGALLTAYRYQAVAADPAGNRDTLVWSLRRNPAGMAISGTGLVSWTPAAGGSFAVEIAVTDGEGGTDTQAWTIVVPAVVSAGGPYTVDEGDSVEMTASCAGCTRYEWDLDNDGTYEVASQSATFDSTDGTASVTVRVRGCIGVGNTNCGTDVPSLVVNNVAPVISSSPSTAGAIGAAYSYRPAATDAAGVNDPIVWSLATKPTGMTIDANSGVIAWTPSAGGNYAVVLRASDGDGGVTAQAFTIAVRVSADAGGPYTVDEGDTLTMNGACSGCDRYEWDLDNNGTYEISTRTAQITLPDGPDSPTMRLRACLGAGTSNCAIDVPTITVNNVSPTIVSTAPTTAPRGRQWRYAAVATDPAVGNADPIRWSLGANPPSGMGIVASTGIATWTPSTAGIYTARIIARDDDGGSNEQVLTIIVPNVVNGGGPYTVDEGSTVTMSATCDRCARYEWDLDGNGSFEHSGRTAPFTGVDGPASTTVRVRGCFDATERNCSTHAPAITVRNVAPVFNSTPPSSTALGATYTYAPSVTDPAGNADTLQFSFVRNPAGMTINRLTGAVSWRPTRGGVAPVTVRVTDDDGATAEQAWTISVLAITLSSSANVQEGASARLTAACDQCNRFDWDLDRDGQFDDASGAIATFDATRIDGAATRTIDIRGCNGANVCVTTRETITITNVAPTITSSPVRTAQSGSSYRYVAAATDPAGRNDPIRWTLVGGPTGMSVSTTGGVVTWTATPGRHAVDLRAADDDGGSVNQQWTIVVVGAEAGGPYTVNEGSTVQMRGACAGCVRFDWDLDNNGSFETSGQTATFDARNLDGARSMIAKFRGCDAGGFCGIDEASINVANVAPEITSTPSTNGTAAQAYQYAAAARDPAGAADPLRWSVVAAPANTTINAMTGAVVWSSATPGSHRFEIRVVDGDSGSDTQGWTVVVPSPIVLSAGDRYEVNEGASVELAATCATCQTFNWDLDADGQYDDASSRTPTLSAAGRDGPSTLTIGVRGCDANNFCGTASAVVEVANVAPSITSTPVATADVLTTYRYQPTATDPAGNLDALRFTLSTSAPGVRIDPATGAISTLLQAPGRFTFALTADDGDGGRTTQNWTLEVRPSITSEAVTVHGQPERVEFAFASNLRVDWQLQIFRRDNGQCTAVRVGPPVAASQSLTFTGSRGGLAPGGDYCWRATAGLSGVTRQTEGVVRVPELPTFTDGPTAAISGLAVDIEATLSDSGQSTLQYASGACSDHVSALRFSGSQAVQIMGGVADGAAVTVESWLDLRGADSQTSMVMGLHQRGFMLQLVDGRPRMVVGGRNYDLTNKLPASGWVHLVATYQAGGNVQLFVNGIRRGQAVAPTGAAPSGGDSVELGVSYSGDMATAAVYNRVRSTAEIAATAAAGPAASFSGNPDGAWNFAEGDLVQSVYDASGNGWAGTLGNALNAAPQRVFAFATQVAMTAGTNPTATLTNLTGGPAYCFRVVSTTGEGTIASAPQAFTRPADNTAPVVRATPLTVAECVSNRSATLTLDAPSVSDDFDRSPSVRAEVGGNVVTFPYRFGMGTTTVRWVATDASGNVGSATQSVRVRDTTDPTATGGTELRVEAIAPTGTAYSPAPAAAADSCGTVSVTNDAPAQFSLGATTVAFDVADQEGNSVRVSRVVRIIDTTGPSFSPALARIDVSSDGSECFAYEPAAPSVADNGSAPERITVVSRHVSGPGAPSCWNLGTHVVEWTITDAQGNRTVGLQPVVVRPSVLTVNPVGLTVDGQTRPTGRFYNEPVTLVFDVSAGTAPYAVTLTPAPARISNVGSRFSAVYEAEGDYSRLQVRVRDESGQGPNFGTAFLAGFGIDLTPPVVTAPMVDQTGVQMADSKSWPPIFVGEEISLERIQARDGQSELVSMQSGLRFDGNDWFTVARPGTGFEGADASALTFEAWVRPTERANATIATVGRNMTLAVNDKGLVTASVRIGGADVVVSGGNVGLDKWHYIVATYDGRALRLYVDAEPADRRLATGIVNLGTDALTAGSGLIGELASVALWRKSLDESEIANRFRGGSGRRIDTTTNAAFVFRFGGASQTVGDASNSVSAWMGSTLGADDNDPTRVVLAHAEAPSASGMVSVDIRIVEPTRPRESVLVTQTASPIGTPLAHGEREMSANRCNANVGAACTPGRGVVTPSEIATWDGGRFRPVYLRIDARDAAGNLTQHTMAFTIMSYTDVLARATVEIDRMLADPRNSGASSELEDARASFEIARSYALMSPPYMDGSYLRADQGIQSISDAEDVGVDVGPTAEYVSRAMAGAIRRHIESVGANLATTDRVMHSDGLNYVRDARFMRAKARHGQMNALSRTAVDAVALLAPEYQRARSSQRDLRNLWEQQLASFDRGDIESDELRTNSTRIIALQRMMSRTRDMLRDAMFPELTAALDNPLTTERRSLEALRDVLDRSSSAADEDGDLIAISDLSVQGACLDGLAVLALGDDSFTRCYLRLNDLARELDTVSETLVHTHRWRAGLAIALQNMLEATMMVSPTGMPWAAATRTTPATLMLPDSMAANVRGSVPMSTLRDADLDSAYANLFRATTAMQQGDVDTAWALFIDERCSIVSIYNRYYSDIRNDTTVADPREQFIDPAAVGCQ